MEELTMYANYHTHTTRCRHAIGTEREYIQSAIDSGIKILGFSDHTPFPGKRQSGMLPEELADYCDTLTALIPEYPQLQMHIGLEVEYNPANFAALLDMLRQYPIEYMILGEHYFFGAPGEEAAQRPHSDRKLLDLHCALCREAMETGLFTYYAHPDVVNFTGDEDYYLKQMRKQCRWAADRKIPMEINLHGVHVKTHYPSDRFWRIAGDEGCTVIIGTDAHDPLEFTNRENLQVALDLVDRFQLNLIDSTPIVPIK